MRDLDVGVTGLALLALLSDGYTPQYRSSYTDAISGQTVRLGEVVKAGLLWLMGQQNADGSIGPPVREAMYNHAVATLALTEAYGITNAIAYRAPAQRAVDFIQAAQTPGLGWRYSPHSYESDTSVTGWCVAALQSGRISGLAVAPSTLEGARAWITRVTDESGRTGYDRLGSDRSFSAGNGGRAVWHPCSTAIGLTCRVFIDRNKDDPVFEQGARIIMADLPSWKDTVAEPSTDFCYWYHATLALFFFDGPRGRTWKRWAEAITDALVEHQRLRKDGCLDGSWDPDVDLWGRAGGRVYATAINTLTLGTRYRNASAVGLHGRDDQKAGKDR